MHTPPVRCPIWSKSLHTQLEWYPEKVLIASVIFIRNVNLKWKLPMCKNATVTSFLPFFMPTTAINMLFFFWFFWFLIYASVPLELSYEKIMSCCFPEHVSNFSVL